MGYKPLEKQSTATINTDLLQATVEEICESLLGEQLVLTDTMQGGLSILTCCISLVSVNNKQNYLLFINCDNSLLDTIAETIFDTDADSIDIDDMLSALQELANMIGGELIKVLEQEFQLGLPFIMDITGDMPELLPSDIQTQIVLKRQGLKQKDSYINVVLTNF